MKDEYGWLQQQWNLNLTVTGAQSATLTDSCHFYSSHHLSPTTKKAIANGKEVLCSRYSKRVKQSSNRFRFQKGEFLLDMRGMFLTMRKGKCRRELFQSAQPSAAMKAWPSPRWERHGAQWSGTTQDNFRPLPALPYYPIKPREGAFHQFKKVNLTPFSAIKPRLEFYRPP